MCPPPACLQVVESTGFVVMPYLEYPQLLGVLLRMLSEGAVTVRREVMKVLGIIGALDPHTHKLNLAQLQGEGRLEREGVRPQFPNKNPTELGESTVGVGGWVVGGRGADAVLFLGACAPPWLGWEAVRC